MHSTNTKTLSWTTLDVTIHRIQAGPYIQDMQIVASSTVRTIRSLPVHCNTMLMEKSKDRRHRKMASNSSGLELHSSAYQSNSIFLRCWLISNSTATQLTTHQKWTTFKFFCTLSADIKCLSTVPSLFRCATTAPRRAAMEIEAMPWKEDTQRVFFIHECATASKPNTISILIRKRATKTVQHVDVGNHILTEIKQCLFPASRVLKCVKHLRLNGRKTVAITDLETATYIPYKDSYRGTFILELVWMSRNFSKKQPRFHKYQTCLTWSFGGILVNIRCIRHHLGRGTQNSGRYE